MSGMFGGKELGDYVKSATLSTSHQGDLPVGCNVNLSSAISNRLKSDVDPVKA